LPEIATDKKDENTWNVLLNTLVACVRMHLLLAKTTSYVRLLNSVTLAVHVKH